ncbi:MAG: hypothetical protein HY898_20645 [Deltaproteobacteria bacterium]|nr:hypothetical protein [Deltaproteobacteria bacterium]
MNPSESNDAAGVTERAIRDLTVIGRTWARYGLTVGRMALETSAITLQKTASVLGDLSTAMKDAQSEEPKEPPRAEPRP